MSDLMSKLNEKYGKNAVLLGTDVPEIPIICSTGSYKLDYVLGCGGIPESKIIEMFGPPSSGKSTFATIMMKKVQEARPDKKVVLIDFESSFKKDYAVKLGLDLNKVLIFGQGDKDLCGEEGFDILDTLARDESISFVVVDSVSAMIPKAILEGEYTDQYMGTQAKMMSQGLMKLNAAMRGKAMTVCFLNQIRMKIGIAYGNPEVTSGGESLKFYAAARLNIRHGQIIGEKENPIGFETTIKVVKNKLGAPMKKITTDIYNGRDGRWGVDYESEMFDLAVTFDIIQRMSEKGSYVYGEENLGRSKEKAIEILKSNKGVFDSINKSVKVAIQKSDAELLKNLSGTQQQDEDGDTGIQEELQEEKVPPKRQKKVEKEEEPTPPKRRGRPAKK